MFVTTMILVLFVSTAFWTLQNAAYVSVGTMIMQTKTLVLSEISHYTGCFLARFTGTACSHQLVNQIFAT